ncbi:unnamed protein product [Microthlaspi erraticum]|uniref:RING-type domain-containing protein n=1 Tax=Microthlaspi erraticum TaxID=1685480 RepID=A0A6D2HRG7_9BRAS|nr:unnamed protein product [Microthlaspi erraticum]
MDSEIAINPRSYLCQDSEASSIDCSGEEKKAAKEGDSFSRIFPKKKMGLEKWLALLYPRVQGGGGRREEECCTVCLMRMEEEDKITSLPCSHEFHSLCVDTWFDVSRKICCPLCRFSPATILLTDELFMWFSSFHF